MELAFCEKDEDILVSLILDIGEVMLTSGAEVSRVEDTIRRIGKAYGFAKVHIFTITNLMVMTVHTSTGRPVTQTRRITSSSVDMEKVARANNLSRSICKEPVPIDELKLSIHDIIYNTKHYGLPMKFFAFLVSASTFTVFFGGNWLDFISSALASLAVCFAVTLCNKLRIQPIITQLVSSFIMAAAICGLMAVGVGSSFDKIVMGNIMLLIPGISLTSSIRDVITGDIVSGLMGICDALLKAFAIAVGCVSMMMLTGMA